jgi:acetyl-CoA C-acetyltransferase
LPVNPSGGLKARGHPVGASGLAQIVEVVKRLRGESGSKRQFNRGLTQSTGGLASNNFVTILERTDASLARTPGFPQPARQVAKSRPATTSMSNEGVIETFTILYVTPDGFLPPLALALVREQNGRLILAQGEESKHLKIGREVSLKRTEDYSLFTLKGRFKMVQDSLRRNLLQRARALVRKPIPADGKL